MLSLQDNHELGPRELGVQSRRGFTLMVLFKLYEELEIDGSTPDTLLTMHGGVKHLQAEYLQGHWALSSPSVPDICISFSRYSFSLLIFFAAARIHIVYITVPLNTSSPPTQEQKGWLAFRSHFLPMFFYLSAVGRSWKNGPSRAGPFVHHMIPKMVDPFA